VSATGGANKTTISWTAVSGATSYNIYWSNTAGVTTATGTRIAGASSPYVHTSLSAGATYYYVVTALNSVGESGASTQASATTSPPPPAVPAAPTGVTATGGVNQVSVSWAAVSGATSYNLYWSRKSGVTTATGTKITGATSPYVQTGLTDSTAYYYIVTAVNSSGESASSAQVTATTNAAAPSLVCSNCHISIPPTTGKHNLHSAFSCASCHGTGYSATTVNLTTHMNGVVNMSSGSGWNATSRSCSPACHGLKNW
jgi:predicted phage tail protein